MILRHPKRNNFFNNMILLLKLIETKEAKHFDCGERAGAELLSCPETEAKREN